MTVAAEPSGTQTNVPRSRRGRRGGLRTRLAGLAAAFVVTLPMFAIALDWGRLINIHVMAIAVVLLAFVLEDRSRPASVPGRIGWQHAAALLAVGMYISTWSIRHCCEHAFGAGLFGGR